MNWQNIGEGIIASLIAGLISSGTVFLFRKFNKKGDIPQSKKFDLSQLSPFLISLFITSFFGVLSLFGFYYQWSKFSYLFIIAFSFGFISVLIYNNQCPNCKRIFTKHMINKETIKEEKRPWYYRDLTIYLYTDGTEKNREYSKQERKRLETWRIEKESYQCEKCGYKWERIFERNLDEHTRPKVQKTIRTKFKNPNNEFNIA